MNNSKRVLGVILTIAITLTSAGCGITLKENTQKDISGDNVTIENDMGDLSHPYDVAFEEPIIVYNRPYEYVIDYRYLDIKEYEKNRVKVAKYVFENNFSSEDKSTEFFKDYVFDYINLQNNDIDLCSLLEYGVIKADLNVVKYVSDEGPIYYLTTNIVFNKDYGDIKKGDQIEQVYMINDECKVVALFLNEFGSIYEIGSVENALLSLEELDIGQVNVETFKEIESILLSKIDERKISK